LFLPQDSPDAAVLVAEVDGRVAGFVEVLLRRSPKQLRVPGEPSARAAFGGDPSCPGM
jgi:hypothetical protein